MEVHKPKPTHNWREFLTEVGIIVIGVLIALAAEQLVQRLEWAHRVASAEDAMRVELLFDDGPQVYQRAAMHPCLQARLDAIRTAVERDAPRAELANLIDGYRVSFLSYDTLAHEAASQAAVADHMTPERLAVWTKAYSMMPYMERTIGEEAAALARLKAMRRSGGRLSEAEQAHVLDAVEALRLDEKRMRDAAGWTLPEIRKLGPLDAQRMSEFMGGARRWYGACIHDLPPDWPKHEPAED